jgi:uncharacterized protein (TIGR02145 family)
MKNPFRILIVVLPLFLCFACNEAKVPVVTTNVVTEISTTTAVSGGIITDDGGGTIMAKGVCWDTLGRPKINDSLTIDTVGSFSFTSHLSGLLPNTTYYVKAYATNIAGTGYGNLETFTTLGGEPSASALDATNIEPHSVTLNGTVTPNLLLTTVEFEYGTTTSYGNKVSSAQSPVTGDTSVAVTAEITDLNPGITYHFRIKAENSLGTIYSSDMTFTTAGKVPDAETETVTSLKLNTVTLNGSVNPNYLSTSVVFEWGTSASYGNTSTPVQNTFTGNIPVNISADLTELIPGTTYHYRIKATNELGTTYGNDTIFKTYVVEDSDHNFYYSVTIGTQTWMQENLKTTHYKDATAIPAVTDNTAWKNLTTPGYCWYNNDEPAYKTVYGALYNWHTVKTGKLCPAGWHIPTNPEWITLTNYLGGESLAGNKLKEAGSEHWGDLNNGTNETGFTALPGGSRKDDGSFADYGSAGFWWSASTVLPTSSYYAVLYNNSGSLVRAGNSNVYGYSVRCIKD